MEDSSGPTRMPLSSATHSENKSFLKEIFSSEDSESELILYSDGSLVVDNDNALIDEKTTLLKLSDVRALNYHGGRYHNRSEYKLLNLISAMCGIFSLYTAPALAVGILYGEFGELSTDLFQYPALISLAHLVPLLFWIYFDLQRGELASPEHLEFIRDDGSKLIINGSLPDGGMHETGTFGVVLGTIFAFFMFMIWVVEQASYLADIILYSILILVVVLVVRKLINYFTDGEQLATIDSLDIPNGITHMYFAAMSTGIIQSEQKLLSPKEIQETDPILIEMREKLGLHESIISSIASTKDIFQAPSASIGVIAIRASTEILMKKACENIGVTWKPNAKPTLDSFIHKFNSKRTIDSRTRTYLDDIRNMGNRASHDFNIDQNEFIITLQRFCDVVEWYSETFTLIGEESE
jgi:hypothetical protein